MKTQASKLSPKIRLRSRAADVAELDFNDSRLPPRTGDPVDADELDTLLPRRRGRQAGLTGASVADDVTADDLSPETLIDEDGTDSAVRRRRGPADTVLRHVDEGDVFSDPTDDPPPDDGMDEVEDKDDHAARPGRREQGAS